MIILRDKDEYGRPQWSRAPEIAFFTAKRSALQHLQDQAIVALPRAEVARLFESQQFHLAPVDERAR